MSGKKVLIVAAIFICTCIAWVILGASTLNRAKKSTADLKAEVQTLFGGELNINRPKIYYKQVFPRQVRDENDKIKNVFETVITPIKLDRSDIRMNVRLDPRKKGVLWFPTYRIAFSGQYVFKDNVGLDVPLQLLSTLESSDAVYDNVRVVINGKEIANILPLLQKKEIELPRARDGTYTLDFSFETTGMENLWYNLTPLYDEIDEINNMKLVITTDFDRFDFAPKTMSPTTKVRTKKGWDLTWDLKKAVTGKDIGLIIPNKINPGDLVSKVTFFAPVPLLFFFAIILIFSVLMKVDIHPMNFFFLAASFFSFHLMYSYFSDQINIYLTFAISAVVSLFLTASYLRLFTPSKFALLLAPAAQLLYLVFFSFSFFFKGTTGLICTIVSVVTLFVLMQVTGKIDWSKTAPRRNE